MSRNRCHLPVKILNPACHRKLWRVSYTDEIMNNMFRYLAYRVVCMKSNASIGRRQFLGRITAGAAASGMVAGFPAVIRSQERRKPNVLFIPVDDLRPQLGCYGHARMISPHIDRMASEGMQFNRAYCQVPVCGASRASLMTGIRPTHNRFIDYYTSIDEDVPGIATLNSHFRQNGYHTISNGKVYHHRTDDPDGWDEQNWQPKGNWVGRGYLDPGASGCPVRLIRAAGDLHSKCRCARQCLCRRYVGR